MRWPWQAHKQIVAERKEAEARAERVHQNEVRSLRRMRQRNHLTDAIVADIRRQLRESGS